MGSATAQAALLPRSCRIRKVPAEGIEPTLPCGNRILSPARLPVPPRRLLCKSGKNPVSALRIILEQRKSGGHRNAQFMAARDSRNRKVQGCPSVMGGSPVQLWADRPDGTKTARKFPLLKTDGQPAFKGSRKYPYFPSPSADGTVTIRAFVTSCPWLSVSSKPSPPTIDHVLPHSS